MVIKFGTDGWRAIMAQDFTFANVEIVVQGVANYLQETAGPGQGIVIGYDNRFLSPEFARRAAEVLLGNDINVLMGAKAMPTPVAAFAVVKEQARGALMFTASHNPPTYNGVKFIPHYGGPAMPEVTGKIEEQVRKVQAGEKIQALLYEEGEKAGLARTIDPKEEYLEHLLALVDREAIKKAELAIAIDPMFGAGVGYLDTLLSRLNCHVEVIHNYRDPLFGGKIPEPSGKVLAELTALVEKPEIVLGLALDGDGDRFGVIDGNGRYITPNQVLSLLLMHLLQKGLRGSVTRTVSTTHMLDRIAGRHNLPILETPVGFKYIGQNLLQESCLIGGEESGGLSINGHLPEKDGVLACLLIVELVALKQATITQLLAELEEEYGQLVNERLDIHCSTAEKERVVNQLKNWRPKQVDGKEVTEHVTVDGLKLFCTDGSWVLIRSSGTEPLFRIYGETGTWEELRSLQQAVRQELGI